MNIYIEIIDSKDQRYPTDGDWQFVEVFEDNGREEKLNIKVSRQENPDEELAIAIHELIEAYLCKKHGISEESVDKWDFSHPDSDDPGSIEGCPYFWEHMIATAIENPLLDCLRLEKLK